MTRPLLSLLLLLFGLGCATAAAQSLPSPPLDSTDTRADSTYYAVRHPEVRLNVVAASFLPGELPDSLAVIEAAAAAGARVAIVPVVSRDREPTLLSGEPFERVLLRLGHRILLTVRPDSRVTAMRVLKLWRKHGCRHRLVTWGGNYTTPLEAVEPDGRWMIGGRDFFRLGLPRVERFEVPGF